MHLGNGRVAVEFEVVGDGSLGSLQAPTLSKLSWKGGQRAPSSHAYTECNPECNRATCIVGLLFYDDVPVDSFFYEGLPLTFRYGSLPYSSVPLTLEQDAVLSCLPEVECTNYGDKGSKLL